ncbi:MAG: aldo/keto reductase [Chloroflexi bacterium]|nr:aldo/keto reductase [Chloroflexota bacterium]OJV94054.1 MAG: aldo/keto reductase [Chloroflexi bacterium 54-19]
MELRSLGRTGVMVSPLCLGAMNFGGPTSEEEGIRIIDAALDRGINFIDTANVYHNGESERIVGKALKQNGKRNSVVLATKVNGAMGPGPNDRSITRYHIMQAVEDSLRRLQTDHIDLYQLHRPAFSFPQDETLRALDDLVRQGKVRYIGTSTFPAWKLMEGLSLSEKYNLARYVSEQPPYNILDRRIENELVPLAEQYGVAIIPWSPIAGGILGGRYPAGQPYPEGSRAAGMPAMAARINPKNQQVVDKLQELAEARNLNAAQLALLWCKDQPGITAPITGPRTFRHYEEAVAILDQSLDDDARKAIDELNPPGTALSDFFNSSNWMKTKIS